MTSQKAFKIDFAKSVEDWLPDILNLTHERARQATLDFLVNQNSPRTQEHYFRILKAFLDWAEKNVLVEDPADGMGEPDTPSLARFTTAQIKAYSEGLVRKRGSKVGQGLENRSKAQVLSCLRSYFDHLVRVGALKANPVLSVKSPKTSAERGAFPPLPAEDVVRILDNFGEGNLKDLQDRAIIALMVFGCARVSAVTRLKYSDVREEKGRFVVSLMEKGDKPHVVPLNQQAGSYLRAYLAKSGTGAKDCDPNPDGYVFRRWSKGRKVLTSRPLDRLVCYRMVNRRAAALGIVHHKLGNHTLRATGITTFINAEGTLEEARRLANHTSTNTTRLYDHNRHGVKIKDVDRIDYGRARSKVRST